MNATARTLCEAFQTTARRNPDDVALRTPGDAVRITWREYAARVRSLAAGLFALGVRRGDTVAMMLTNRPEFPLVDTAAVHLGAAPFSVYNTFAKEQIEGVLANAKSRVLVTERRFLDRVRAVREASSIEHIVCVDLEGEILTGVMSLDDLELVGAPGFDFDTAWHAVQPSDVLTLIYTSGTTGAPKGVELTHANILAELGALAALLPVRDDEKTISYLPSAHIADRVVCLYMQTFFGICITCVDDLRAIGAALLEVRPTVWGAVPRVWEKLKVGIEARIATAADDATKQTTLWALEVGRRKVRAEQAALRGQGSGPDAALLAEYARADALVLARVRASIGLDAVRWLMCGAAPIGEDVLEFFASIGLPICEVWGMSELSAVATLNPLDRGRIGTVGLPVPGVEVRLAPDGEVLVRGRIVMKGYRGQPRETAETIDGEGWLRTGDIGAFDEAGYLRIIDRKKELIINAAGKNMSPANIEGTLKAASPLIGHAVCIGDRRPYNVALLVLDPDGAAAWAKTNDIIQTDLTSLASHPRLRAHIDAAVACANERLSRVEQIKRYALLTATWDPGSDEVTPTMKLKRRPIADKYAAEIEALYAG